MTGEARVDNNSIRGYKDITCPGESLEKISEGTAESAPVEETITINGKTYTKSELKKLLE